MCHCTMAFMPWGGGGDKAVQDALDAAARPGSNDASASVSARVNSSKGPRTVLHNPWLPDEDRVVQPPARKVCVHQRAKHRRNRTRRGMSCMAARQHLGPGLSPLLTFIVRAHVERTHAHASARSNHTTYC